MGHMFMSANEMQDKLDNVVENLSGQENQACFITSAGQTRAVLVDIDRYNAMMDALEDAEEMDANGWSLIDEIIGRRRPN